MANSKKSHESMDKTMDMGGRGNKNRTIYIASLALVSLLVIGGFSYFGLKIAKTPQEVSNQINPTQQTSGGILYSEQNFSINITGKSGSVISKEISTELSKEKIPTGKIKSFTFTYTSGSSTPIVPASVFLNVVAPSVPDILARNLKDEYVFGYYSYDSNEPFLILKSANYDSIFAGMLEWERSMYTDLGGLIFRKGSLSVSQTTVNTSTSTKTSTSTASTSMVLNKATSSTKINTNISNSFVPKSEYDTSFVDKIISNNDTRVLYRPNGNIAFFYTFFNKDTIIIATSEQTLREIIYRLTSGKITR